MDGTLENGLFKKAMDLRKGQYAAVTEVQSEPVSQTCLGNLTLCPNGFTTKFYLFPKELRSDGRTYFLSTGMLCYFFQCTII